jgi:hypothetical protein
LLGPDQDLHDVLSGVVELPAPEQALYDLVVLGFSGLLSLPSRATGCAIASRARVAACALGSVFIFIWGFAFLVGVLALLLSICRLLLVAGCQHRILSGQHERLHQVLQAILDPVHYCFVIVVGIGLLTQTLSFE